MRNIFISGSFLLLSISAHGTKLNTIADGNWEDSTVWSGGISPGYSFQDTVEITRTVFFNEDLHVQEFGMLVITDSGKICGHHNIYCAANTEIDLMAKTFFDTIFTYGYLYGHSTWPQVGHLIRISYPGHAYIHGYWSLIYYEFECGFGPDSFPPPPPPPTDSISTVEMKDTVQIDVGPSPFTDWIHIKVRGVINDVYLTDDIGRLILKRKFESNELQLGFLAPGIYFLNFIVADGRIFTKKIVKRE